MLKMDFEKKLIAVLDYCDKSPRLAELFWEVLRVHNSMAPVFSVETAERLGIRFDRPGRQETPDRLPYSALWRSFVDALWRASDRPRAHLVEHGIEEFCANAYWYGAPATAVGVAGAGPPLGGFKERLMRAVGWEAEDVPEEMRTTQAWDACQTLIYELLPPCLNCACVGSPAASTRRRS